MKKDLLVLIWSLGIGVPLVAVASGGYYLFHSENTKNAGISAEIAAKAPVTDTFNPSQSANSPADAFIPAANVEAAYTALDDAVTVKTDPLFSDPTTTNPKIILKTDPDTQAQIDTLRAKITTTLDDWQALVQKVNVEGTSQESDTEVRQYADDVQKYIAELKSIVDGLTPDNSGLTPEEIAADQAAVDAAIQEANKAIVIIDTPPSPTSTPESNNNADNNYTPPSGQDTSSGQSGSSGDQNNSPSNSNDSSNDQGNPSPSPSPTVSPQSTPPPDDTPFNQPDNGSPRLIEGSNSI